MNRRFYSKAHFERLSNAGPYTSEATRIALRAASELANREMMARFAPLTPENAIEAVTWQAERIKELQKELLKNGGGNG